MRRSLALLAVALVSASLVVLLLRKDSSARTDLAPVEREQDDELRIEGAGSSVVDGTSANPRRAVGGEGPARSVEAEGPDAEFVAVDPGALAVALERADGSPLAGVDVDVRWRVHGGTYRNQSSRSDAHGRVQAPIPHPGQLWSLELAVDDGRYSTRRRALASPSSRAPRVVRARLEASRSIEILVVDEAGRPVAGAPLEVQRIGIAEPDPHVLTLLTEESDSTIEVTTDGDGLATLRLGLDLWEIQPAGTEGLSRTFRVPSAGAPPRPRVVLPGPSTEREVLVEILPAPGIEAKEGGDDAFSAALYGSYGSLGPDERGERKETLVRRGERWVAHVPRRGTWGIYGQGPLKCYGFAPIPPGARSVVLQLEGGLVFSNEPDPTIEGVVVSASTGELIPATIMWQDWPLRDAGWVTSEISQGRFSRANWEGVRLWVGAEGHAWKLVGPFDVMGADSLRISLAPGHRLEGRLIGPSGAPVEATVLLYRSTDQVDGPHAATEDGILTHSTDLTRTDSGGRFWFDGLTRGRVRLVARPDDGVFLPAQRVVRGDAGKVTITLGDGAEGLADLTGTVRERGGGAAAAGIDVIASWEDLGPRQAHTRTGDQGTFMLRGLPPAGVTLVFALPKEQRAFSPYARHELMTGELMPGGNVLDVELDRACVLHIQLAPSRVHEQPPALGVRLPGQPRTWLVDRWGITEDDLVPCDRAGRADLVGVPRAAVELLVYSGEYESTPIAVIPLDLNVLPGGRIQIPFPE